MPWSITVTRLPAVMGLVIGALVLVSPLAASDARAQESGLSNVAILDLQKVLAESKAAQSARSARETYADRYQAQAAEQEQALREKDKDLAQQRSLLSPEAFGQRGRELREELSAFQRSIQIRRRQLEAAFGQAMNRVQGEVVKIADRISEQNGYDLLLYRSQVFLYNPELDITGTVLERLNATIDRVPFPDPESIGVNRSQTAQ